MEPRFIAGIVVGVVLVVVLIVLLVVFLPGDNASTIHSVPQAFDAVSGTLFTGAVSPDSTVETFLGIKYANVVNRFELAEPASYASVYNATQFGPMCYQSGRDGWDIPLSEECLYLNVYRPAGVDDTFSLPVAVWIHGGGFASYAASDWLYNATNFTKSQNVVVVTLNYRLGPLGFLCVDDAQCTGGTNGMMDQIEALRWVQSYVAAFGGDPSSVSLFGQSAGGMAVCMLSLSSKAAGLFHRAIVESGPCIGDTLSPYTPAVGAAVGRQWLAQVNANSLEELRNTSAFPMETFTWGSVFGWPAYGDPNGVLVESPATLLASSSSALHVSSMMLGSTTFDGSAPFYLAFLPAVDNLTTFARYATEYFFIPTYYPAAHQEAILELYDPDTYFNGSYAAALIAMAGDYQFTCPTIRLSQLVVNASNSTKAFLYSFGHLYGRDNSLTLGVMPPDILELYPTWAPTFASHEAELPFVFGNSRSNTDDVPFTGEEVCLSDLIMSRWSAFMATGAPTAASPSSASTGDGSACAASLEWPPANAGPDIVGVSLETHSVELPANFRSAKCAALYPQWFA